MRELIFTQDKQGYRYNIDTFLLFDFASNAKFKGRVLDVGCGCGIIGILLKENFPNIELSLLDIMQQNCDLSKRNLVQNALQARVICADFADFKSDEKFDFIISNPPFYRQGALQSENELVKAGKSSHSLSLSSFINASNALLKPNGTLCFCYEVGALQELCTLLSGAKLKLTRLKFVHTNARQRARLVLVETKKGSKSPCELQNPLFVYENDELSAKMQEIYTTIKVKSVDL